MHIYLELLAFDFDSPTRLPFNAAVPALNAFAREVETTPRSPLD